MFKEIVCCNKFSLNLCSYILCYLSELSYLKCSCSHSVYRYLYLPKRLHLINQIISLFFNFTCSCLVSGVYAVCPLRRFPWPLYQQCAYEIEKTQNHIILINRAERGMQYYIYVVSLVTNRRISARHGLFLLIVSFKFLLNIKLRKRTNSTKN